MKINLHGRKFMAFFCILIFLTMAGSSIVSAQQSTQLTEAEIRSLLNKRFSPDNNIVDEATKGLSKLDARSLPTLKNIFNKGTLCEQVVAAEIIIEFHGRDNTELLPQLIKLADKSPYDSLSDSNDWLCRRSAAFLLQFSASGIRALTKLLRHKSLYIRQNAIFGFDDLTEVGAYEGDSLQAIKESIPVIAKGTYEKDDIVNDMSNEILTQMSGDPRLTKLVESALESKRKHRH